MVEYSKTIRFPRVKPRTHTMGNVRALPSRARKGECMRHFIVRIFVFVPEASSHPTQLPTGTLCLLQSFRVLVCPPRARLHVGVHVPWQGCSHAWGFVPGGSLWGPVFDWGHAPVCYLGSQLLARGSSLTFGVFVQETFSLSLFIESLHDILKMGLVVGPAR